MTIFASEALTWTADLIALPSIPAALRFKREEIDQRATTVAAAAATGAVSEGHARRVIAALLYGSTIPEKVAARWTCDRQDRADIADRLRLLRRDEQAVGPGPSGQAPWPVDASQAVGNRDDRRGAHRMGGSG